MSEVNEFMNNFIRKNDKENEAKSRGHLKRLFGDKKSDDYIRGYQDGAKMATDRAIENLNTKLGIEDKQDD
jgi:hypothetical protein